MKKLAIYILAISAGLIVVVSTACAILGVIYAINYSLVWLLLEAVIIPAVPTYIAISKAIDKIHEQMR